MSNNEERYPIKEEDEGKIIDRFCSINFCCVRCGLENLEKSNIKPYADSLNFTNASPDSFEATFYTTGDLICNQCGHKFLVKIQDEGKLGDI
ncbi:MAG TPA: hypothetical protein VH500_24075 [Nitrososphaeraceae archaeon]|jgi:DNA-directed RNA polymerase subunit RPC12/RpoP